MNWEKRIKGEERREKRGKLYYGFYNNDTDTATATDF